MEKYVVSRELARLLERKGYPQHTSIYAWITAKADPSDILLDTLQGHSKYELQTHEIVSAPLSDELLEQLDAYIDKPGQERYYLHGAFSPGVGSRNYWYQNNLGQRIKGPYNPTGWMTDNKSADALAKLWIWCRMNGYIEGIEK